MVSPLIAPDNLKTIYIVIIRGNTRYKCPIVSLSLLIKAKIKQFAMSITCLSEVFRNQPELSAILESQQLFYPE